MLVLKLAQIMESQEKNRPQSIYPNPTAGPLASKTNTSPEPTAAMSGLRRYIMRIIVTRALVDIVLAILIGNIWLRTQDSVVIAGPPFSASEMLTIILFGWITLICAVAGLCNLYGLLSIGSFYRSFNRSFYIPMAWLFGTASKLFAVFEFLRFLSPFTWIVSPKSAVDALINSGESAVNGIIADQNMNTAYKVDQLIQVYQDLRLRGQD